jgi:hypothetical protein
MNHWTRRMALMAAAVMAGATTIAGAPAEQVAGAAPPARALPRTSDGKPDLAGIWQALNAAAWDIQDHAARPDAPAGLGVVEGPEIPYQPWAAKKKAENFQTNAMPSSIHFTPWSRTKGPSLSP